MLGGSQLALLNDWKEEAYHQPQAMPWVGRRVKLKQGTRSNLLKPLEGGFRGNIMIAVIQL